MIICENCNSLEVKLHSYLLWPSGETETIILCDPCASGIIDKEKQLGNNNKGSVPEDTSEGRNLSPNRRKRSPRKGGPLLDVSNQGKGKAKAKGRQKV